jgi:hypothetical protein
MSPNPSLAVASSVRRALNRGIQAAASEGQLAFTRRTLDPSSNLASILWSETVASGPDYTAGAFIDGALHLAG